MACARANLAGEDDEGNSASFNIDVCVPTALCEGASFEQVSEEGTGTITIEAGACEEDGEGEEEQARHMLIGFAAAVTAVAMNIV